MSNKQGTLDKAQLIVNSGGVKVVTPDQEWSVQGTKDTYSVTRVETGLYCEKLKDDVDGNGNPMVTRVICPSWRFLSGVPQEDRYCKHTEAVKLAWLNQDAHVKAYYKQKGGD